MPSAMPFGSRPGGETRYVIAPYLEYWNVDDLAPFDRCAQRYREDERRYYRCFVIDEDTQRPRDMPTPRRKR